MATTLTPLSASANKPQMARVLTYSQDPLVGPVIEDSLEVSKIGDRVDGPRISIWDETTPKASADLQGNFLIQPDRKQFDQVQAFVSSQKTLDLFEGLAGGPLPWAFESPTLGVGPHAGEGVNAYYQRSFESLSFYYFDSKALNKTIQTSQSADLVSHETGHAILDGLKPEYGHTFDLETKAFHEAFGDCAAMFLTLSRPANRQNILAETGGDLSKDNCLCRIGEEFGKAVRLLNTDPSDDRDYLRNARNEFKYANPTTLPADGPRETLSAEPHSFCEIWTGAVYRAIQNVYGELSKTMPADQALEQSGQTVGKLFLTGLQMSSPARARYGDIALSMVRADQLLNGGKNQQALSAAFAAKGLPNAPLAVPDLTWSTPIKTAADAEPFLREHAAALGVDGGHYNGFKVTRTDKGLTCVEYLEKEAHIFGRFSEDVRSGLTLTFDPSGKLAHVTKDPVTSAVLAAEARGINQETARALESHQPATWRTTGVSLGGTTTIEKLPTFID